MPAFRIVYIRNEASGPETITAGFDNLDQALSAFAGRGLRILYIAEKRGEPRVPATMVDNAAARRAAVRPAGRTGCSFPLRRFSARAVA